MPRHSLEHTTIREQSAPPKFMRQAILFRYGSAVPYAVLSELCHLMVEAPPRQELLHRHMQRCARAHTHRSWRAHTRPVTKQQRNRGRRPDVAKTEMASLWDACLAFGHEGCLLQALIP